MRRVFPLVPLFLTLATATATAADTASAVPLPTFQDGLVVEYDPLSLIPFPDREQVTLPTACGSSFTPATKGYAYRQTSDVANVGTLLLASMAKVDTHCANVRNGHMVWGMYRYGPFPGGVYTKVTYTGLNHYAVQKANDGFCECNPSDDE